MGILSGVTLTKVDPAANGPKFALGTEYESQEGKKYRYFQYTTAAGLVAPVAGDVVYFYAPGGVSAGSGTVVTADVSDSARVGAGIAPAVMANNDYGWFQQKGLATLAKALIAGADGNSLTAVGAGVTDGTLTVSALVTDSICAHAIDASAKIIMCNFP